MGIDIKGLMALIMLVAMATACTAADTQRSEGQQAEEMSADTPEGSYDLSAVTIELEDAHPPAGAGHLRNLECFQIIEESPDSQDAYWLRPLLCPGSPGNRVRIDFYLLEHQGGDIYVSDHVIVNGHSQGKQVHKLEMEVKARDANGVPNDVVLKITSPSHSTGGGGSHPGHANGRG